MAHIDEILSRLPQLYREGELVREVLSVPALQIEIADELAREVQRAHWFDSAYDLEDVVGLAKLLNIEHEPWQNINEYRAWVHSIRNAWLRHGTATLKGLKTFVLEYTLLFKKAVHTEVILSFLEFSDKATPNRASFVENPAERKQARIPDINGSEPLYQFEIIQTGLDETFADFLLVGLPGPSEYIPVIINTMAEQALIYLGEIPTGKRLWIKSNSSGNVTAYLENKDVTDKLYSVENVTPGIAWGVADAVRPAKAMKLKKGKNDLWFLPVAHFDENGLDRCLMAMADLLLKQGRFDETTFDASLFYQDPAVILNAAWIEHEPASFQINLPAGAMVHKADEIDDALENRDQLGLSLNSGVQKLKAAGVRAEVVLQPFKEIQGQRDFLTDVQPKIFREIGPTGADRLPDGGGTFGVTSFEDSTYR
jgi:hypothetical protein